MLKLKKEFILLLLALVLWSYISSEEPLSQDDLRIKIEGLIKDLASEDEAKKEEAFQHLAQLGEAAEEELVKTFLLNNASSISPQILAKIKELLANLGLKAIIPEPEIFKLKEKLSTITHNFLFNENSLLEHTGHLTQLYEIPFFYEPSARELAQEKKTFALQGLPLKVSLNHILSQYGLSYTFRKGGIWLIKPKTLIKQLVITPPREIPELDKTIYHLLNHKIEFPFQQTTSLSEVFAFLRESMPELNIIAAREVPLNKNLSIILNNCPLSEVLSEMLQTCNLGYIVKEGVLLIVPYQKLLKGLLSKLETLLQTQLTSPPMNIQIRYEIFGWKQNKPDQILFLDERKTLFATLEKNQELTEFYRTKTSPETVLDLIKTFLRHSFFELETPEIKLALDEEHLISLIKFSLDTYHYQLWFPLTIDLAIPEDEKELAKLQAIEKKFHQLINEIKQKGLRIKP